MKAYISPEKLQKLTITRILDIAKVAHAYHPETLSAAHELILQHHKTENPSAESAILTVEKRFIPELQQSFNFKVLSTGYKKDAYCTILTTESAKINKEINNLQSFNFKNTTTMESGKPVIIKNAKKTNPNKTQEVKAIVDYIAAQTKKGIKLGQFSKTSMSKKLTLSINLGDSKLDMVLMFQDFGGKIKSLRNTAGSFGIPMIVNQILSYTEILDVLKVASARIQKLQAKVQKAKTIVEKHTIPGTNIEVFAVGLKKTAKKTKTTKKATATKKTIKKTTATKKDGKYKKTGQRHLEWTLESGKTIKRGDIVTIEVKGKEVQGEFRHVNINVHSPKGYAVVKVDGKIYERATNKIG